MEVIVDRSFKKDFEKVPAYVKKQVAQFRESLLQVTHIDALHPPIKYFYQDSAGRYYYRKRFGDYRLGLYIEENTVYLSRILTRGEIYKYFPPN
ncbi:MAG: type II toxin-antitoxin system RelE/ParE family toxin [Chitinophagaceae bacterium]